MLCNHTAHYIGYFPFVHLEKKEALFMNRSGMKCVLYPRVSTEMQIDGFS